MQIIAKYFKFIVLTGILLLSVGCSGSGEERANAVGSESEQNIRAVLQNTFNGPDEKKEKILDGPDGDLKKYTNRLAEYNNENFKPYLSERFFENYVVNSKGSLRFLQIAHPDYELKTKDITIKEGETIKNAYDFTVEVSYSKNGSDESKTIEVKGYMKTNEKEEVVGINYSNQEEFRQALE